MHTHTLRPIPAEAIEPNEQSPLFNLGLRLTVLETLTAAILDSCDMPERFRQPLALVRSELNGLADATIRLDIADQLRTLSRTN